MRYTYNVLDIIRGTSVDGPGLRTSIYLAGCNHHCPGCHNPQSWDFNGGERMTLEEIMYIVREEDFDVTLSGGDPLMHPEAVEELVEAIVAEGHNVWLYTGFTWDEIMADPRLCKAVRLVDTVVEGPFIESMKEDNLRFRGSLNQRFIHPSEWL